MARFVGRQREMSKLHEIVQNPGAQFLTLYGRRRVGKTALLRHWVQESGLPSVYWVADRLSPALQLRSFSQALYNEMYPDMPADAGFAYPTWEMALQNVARMASERLILILDKYPYLAQAEPGLPSVLQNAWDQHLKRTQIVLVLAGSQIGIMSKLLDYNAPLYGRFTGHLHLKPLPFADLIEFLPRYSAAERVAVYAILGGIPTFLERFDDGVPLAENVQRHILTPTGILRGDPLFLLQEVREPRNYLSILQAIGEGEHTLGEIARTTGLAKQNVSTYLGRLADLHLAERRTPVTLPPKRRERSRQGRWHLRDPYLRFYFRFVAPNRRALELELTDAVWANIDTHLRAYVGMTAFKELCREWVLIHARSGHLPFASEDVGSHWAADAHMDVVAISWREKAILLGECKWGTERVDRALLRELIAEKTPKVLAALPDRGESWTVHYAFFARAGFTEATETEAERHKVQLVDLRRLDRDLQIGAS